jgi:hypothetical protein
VQCEATGKTLNVEEDYVSKYAPLGEYLKRQNADRVTLTFQQVEQILGFALPASAHTFRQWWENDEQPKRVPASSWMEAGWRTADVSLTAGRVTLVRAPGG